MDFMTQLPEWNRMDAFLVVVNRFSKLAKLTPINNFQLGKFVFWYVGQASQDATIRCKW
jgi:hypothetical protein